MRWYPDHPAEYFSRFLVEPIVVPENGSVREVMDRLNEHPIWRHGQASDILVRPDGYDKNSGELQLFHEQQELWSCYVKAEDEQAADPPVFLCSFLDLVEDLGIAVSEVVDRHRIRVCDRFSQFVWHMLGRIICIRLALHDYFQDSVRLSRFDWVELDNSLTRALPKEFPHGFDVYFGETIICVPDWGAICLTEADQLQFLMARKTDNLR